MFIFSILNNKKLVFMAFMSLFFFINLSIYFSKYLDLVYEEVYKDKVQVLNIYEKQHYDVLKLKSDNYEFFTSIPKENSINKLDYITIIFITKHITFLDYLKGFYAKNISYEKLNISTFRQNLSNKITDMHYNSNISEIFNALFLAIPTNSNLREVFTNYSISHLIALSGFHIAVLSFIVYIISYYPYSLIHRYYFPYRNKKADIVLFTITLIFLYLIFTGFIPSLLRAFVMLVIGYVLLRNNIKIISFQTLGITLITVITLFPNYLFSIGFWFSISAVFYIFLYLKYFVDVNKYFQLIFFNFWIFFIFNPIVHYFFYQTTYEQLFSPFISIAFTVFYPFEILIHILGFSSILDGYLISFIDYKINVFDVITPSWFFILFILVSLFSTRSKKAFYLLNLLTVFFNIYLYYT